MAKMKRVEVVYEKEDGLWFVSVPAVRGCHTQAKSVAQARERIREALGLFIDNAKSVELEDRFRLPAEIRKAVTRFMAAKAKAEAEQMKARDAARESAAALKKQSFTMRDAGEVLGLSHQRVQQLLEA